MTQGTFLTAVWRDLVMLNYEIDPHILEPFVPPGVELDQWNGRTYVSIVGFRFLRTRLLGFLPVPFHTNFDEVNLRFYVRRREADGWRRGVVFIKELVPRRAIAFVARRFYNENYVSTPMHHGRSEGENGHINLAYGWYGKEQQRWQGLHVTITGEPQPAASGSAAEFITEHYWGYTRQPDGSTLAYQVEHPPWRIWTAVDQSLECDVATLYGEAFVPALSTPPASAFVAEGSAVAVHRGETLST